jgi:hypothetical protein
LDPLLNTLISLLLALAGLVGQGAAAAIGTGTAPGTDQTTDAAVAASKGLPSNLTPTLSKAVADTPASYSDGCHLQPGQSKAKVCTYGDKHASRKVLLFGDSHAASWLPALDALGKSEHWRILNLTKSACPIPSVTVAVRGRVAPDCATWRTNALAKIKSIHPDLVIGTSIDHVYTIPGKSGAAFQPAWQAGMTTTLTALRTRADKVILLADTPLWAQQAPDCLRHHMSNIAKCATRRSDAVFANKVASAREAATDANVAFADPSPITCVADPCPVVVGKYLLLRDDSHMTATWSRHLAPALKTLLAPVAP